MSAIEDDGWEERESLVMDIAGPLWLDAPTVATGLHDPVFEPAVPAPHSVTVLARGGKLRYDANLMPDAEPTEEYRVVILPRGRPSAHEA